MIGQVLKKQAVVLFNWRDLHHPEAVSSEVQNRAAGWGVLSEEDDADGNTGSLVRTYYHGLAQFEGSNPASPTARKYATHDHLGSTRSMYDDSLGLVASYDYTPYGDLLHASHRDATTERFTGHTWDAASALYFAPFRHYSPAMARWTTRDPLGMVDGPNLYAYVGGNPIVLRDLLGLDYLTFDGCELTWVFEDTVWEFNVGSQTWYPRTVETGKKRWKASSGAAGEFKPIPEGRYWTGPGENKEDKHLRAPDAINAWGPIQYRLHPWYLTWVQNKLKGRAGFFIHGGYAAGTAGCIEFCDYSVEQKWLHEFHNHLQTYGKRITLYVDYTCKEK